MTAPAPLLMPIWGGQDEPALGPAADRPWKHRRVVLLAMPTPHAEEPALDVPLGLCYLSAVLKTAGFPGDVRLVDFNTRKDFDYYSEGKEYLQAIPLDGDFYGIQILSTQLWWAIEVCRYLRGAVPGAAIVIGGPHCDTEWESALKDTDADAVVSGEAEGIIEELVRDGWERFGKVIYGGLYHDVDELSFPDRSIAPDLEAYNRTLLGERAFHVISGRGCVKRCSFCASERHGSMRLRSPENFVAEIQHCIETYGVRHFVFVDDIFTVKPTRLLRMCDLLEPLKIRFRCWARVDMVNDEILMALKRAGVVSITFGVEHFDDRMLKLMQKDVTSGQNKAALKLCKTHGINARCSLIFGHPGETMESVDAMIAAVEEVQPDEWWVSTFIPIPGSPTWADPKKFGFRVSQVAVQERKMQDFYLMGGPGRGGVVVQIDSMPDPQEFLETREYLLRRLQEVCPRKVIQDTSQQIQRYDWQRDWVTKHLLEEFEKPGPALR